MLTGDEIRSNLAKLASRWDGYEGSERAGAQNFCADLLNCYGVDWKDDGADFEYPQEEGGFVDLFKPGAYLFEMKAPHRVGKLDVHRLQARTYWERAADAAAGVPSPRFMVLCAFHEFEIWEPGRYPKDPRLTLTLRELPDRYEALLFLAGEDPVFTSDRSEITTEATSKVAEIGEALTERREGGPDERRDFILQSVWCMFAEDLGMIPAKGFTKILDLLAETPSRSSSEELGRLFELLADNDIPRPDAGLYKGTPYANGGLFADPARLHLEPDELQLMRDAARYDWKKVEPSIFGNLLERSLGHDQQWHLGAHYTHEVDIQEIVEPTIVRPWQERIDAISNLKQGKQAQNDLLAYVVLDPACGSGNFLYVAYRELRRIEKRLSERVDALAQASGAAAQGALSAFYPIQNMRGIEINPFAVALARLTLWMGHKLAVEELGVAESTLPLTNLSGIQTGDALEVDWPRAQAVIGNPPYHGSQNLRKELGDDRVRWLDARFGCGVKDLCVYWFRRAADTMQPGDRAGLVGTNSISQNKARSASLNHVIEKGGVITDAVSKRKWPGDAVVNVSIVNWVQKPDRDPGELRLDGEVVKGINTRLRESLLPVEEYERLEENRGRSFQGPIPGADFYLDAEEAEELRSRADADYTQVVRPYLNGEDIANEPGQRPSRHVIDFGYLTLEQASAYPAALDLLRGRVKPVFEASSGAEKHSDWWQFRRPRGKMRDAISGMPRFIAANAQGKRFLFAWQPAEVCPSNLTNVFAFDDDYAIGVLTSGVHMAWADAEMSTLRIDRRYTPTSCFETFPWPEPDGASREAIGSISAALIEARQSICAERGIGLTTLYNEIDEGAYKDIAKLHSELDVSVADAYGWGRAVVDEPLEVRRLLAERHAEIARGGDYDPFAYQAAAAGTSPPGPG